MANLQKPTLHRSLSCHKPWEVRSDGQSSACNHNFFMSPKAAKKSESSPITNKTLCVSCWDKQLTDLSAEKITKMILEGTFFPENIQCHILAKPWKIKFWCGNCISSHTRNAFGKQFKLIHGQKTNKHFVDIEAAGWPDQSPEQEKDVSTCTLCWAGYPWNLSGQGISVPPQKHREDRWVNSDSSGLFILCATRSHVSNWCHLYLCPNVGSNRHLSSISEDR